MKEIHEICTPVFQEYIKESETKVGSLEDYQNLMQKIVDEQFLTERLVIAREILQGYALFDLEKITNWSLQCLDLLSWELGEADQFIDEQEFSGWPIRATPISQRPFLKIGHRYFCFSVFGLCDHFYRVVEKTVRSHSQEMITLWEQRQIRIF